MGQGTTAAQDVHPRVVAVVLNWERAALTVRCVESLLAMGHPNLQVVVSFP